jgi:DNA helicase II / ATP-dependent DNA helicase PcrA
MDAIASKFRARVEQGYGVIVTDVPEKPDLESHWASSLDIRDIFKISRADNLHRSRETLLHILHRIDANNERRSFLLFTDFSAEEIFRFSCVGAVTRGGIDKACFFDLFRHISEGDNYCSRFSDPPKTDEEVLTPIENILMQAMNRGGLEFETQVRMGKRIADFLVTHNGQKLVVEADGVQYHVPALDKKRDIEILAEFGIETMRFGGSQIWRAADECVAQIKRRLQKLDLTRPEYAHEDIADLDSSQLKAMNNEKGSVLVVAPAGSGKTKVIINRVAELLNRGVDPQGILCLAFNAEANKTLADRLTDLSIPNKRAADFKKKIRGVTVATVHSLGFNFLREFTGQSFDMNTDDQRRKLAFEVLRGGGMNLPPLRGVDHAGALLNELARIKAGLYNPAEEEIQLSTGPNKTQLFEVGELFNSYVAANIKTVRLDFDDQIYQALSLLMINPSIRNDVQRRYSHIIIDEYQDLSQAQIAMIRLLAGKGQEVFAVGDDDQLIYSWRHVSDRNLMDFADSFPRLENHPLSTNYRSASRIVRFSQNLIKHNKNRVDKNVTAAREQNGDFVLSISSDLNSQLAFLVKGIKTRTAGGGDQYRTIAVLSRYREQHILIANALDKAGIPRYPIKGRLYSSEIADLFLTYLKVLRNPVEASAKDIKKIINRPNRYLSNDFIKKLDNATAVWDVLKQVPTILMADVAEHQYGLFRSALGEKWKGDLLREFVDHIEHLHHHFGHDKPHVVGQKVVDTIAFIQPEQKKSEDVEKADDAALVDIIIEDSKSYKSLDDFLEHAEGQAAFERNEIHTPAKQKKQKEEFDTNKVRIETIHWAKGREWNTVFLFDLSDRAKKKSSKSGGKGEPLSEEERRVAYVGMTRAINNLSISTQSQMVSPFILEALVPQELRVGSNAASRLDATILQLEEHVAKLTVSEDKQRQMARRGKIWLRERTDVLTQTRGKLEEEWIELVREKPAGLISRTFLGGRSAADIQRVKREVVSRIGDIDRELADIAAKAEQADKKPKMTKVQKQTLLKEQETALGDYRLLSKYIKQLMPA